jgi:4,5-dihydroxyphthalate decarboxylase
MIAQILARRRTSDSHLQHAAPERVIMPGVPLSMAISSYDHVADLINGRIRPEGIDLNVMELPIEEVFFRMLNFAEWDVAEFSMAKYVSMVGAGTEPFRALPVFPSRVFRQSAFYISTQSGIQRAADFAGRRIGIPEWAQTAGVYARAYLQHQCGVRLADVRWVQSGVNQPGRTEKVGLALHDGVNVDHVHDRSLNDLLLAGEIDGIISAREPAAFLARDPRIARLWPAYQEVEETYYRETGIFPIMHAVVVKKETLERHPWIAMNLFRAFDDAKKNSLRRISSIVNSRVAIPWSHQAYDRAQNVLGSDFWPYGIEDNLRTLEAFVQFCCEQGLISRKLRVAELFPREVGKFYKV